MSEFYTPEELEERLGAQLRNLRILRNLDQRDLAKRAGVALNVVKRLESGKTSTTTSLIKVLKILNRTEWLNTLAPQIAINPIQMTPSKAPRQRVFRERKSGSVTAKDTSNIEKV